METKMRSALVEYAQTLKKRGWEAADKLIPKYQKLFPDFRKWAYALGIMLRAGEILAERRS